MARKGDFSEPNKITLAQRVNYFCSNPECLKSTAGPHINPQKRTLNGEAAHIHSAKERGPRYDQTLSLEYLSSIKNAIWLCCNCHTVVDADDCRYSAKELKEWKKQAEDKANSNQIKPINKNPDEHDTELKQLWVHETTNDKDYVPRNTVLNKLDSWMKSKNTKVITVTGIGGQGKTSLVGYWIKEAKALTNRKFDGLFYWSFYSEQDTEIFFKSLIKYACSNFNCDPKKVNQKDLLNSLRYIFSEFSICVILDGLEVIQYELSNRSKGQFVDGELRNFLIDLCLSKNDSLAILTSRFEIVDLRQFSKHVNNLLLGNLNDIEASQLLQRLYVGGTESDHSSINILLEGHPLALRVFAAGLPRERQGNPISHLNAMMETLPQGVNALSQKINRLLSTYEQSINEIQIALLSGVSLLHKPIDEQSLLLLSVKQLEKSFCKKSLDTVLVKSELSSLVATGLVLKELVSKKFRYSCHPIIRDYFRLKVTGNNEQGDLVGEFLANRPGELKIEDNDVFEWIVSAIEVLSECGNWYDASYLYEYKLEDGLTFIKLAKPEYGWRCALVLSKASRKQIKAKSIFGFVSTSVKNTQSFYLNAAGQFSLMMGDLDNAVEFYRQALSKLGTSSSFLNKSRTYDGLASTSIQRGNLYDAYEYLKQSIELASKRKLDEFFINQLHISRGQLHLLNGEFAQAKVRYRKVYGAYKGSQKKNTDLKASGAYGLAEVALHNFEYDIASKMIDEGDRFAELNNRQDLLLLGHYLKGWVLYETNNAYLASNELSKAEKIARLSRMEYWIIKISILQSMVYSKLELIEKACVTIEDCIEVSSSRKFDILKVDSLIAKAVISIDKISEGKVEQILDYLTEAKILAENIGYHLVFETINTLERLLNMTK